MKKTIIWKLEFILCILVAFFIGLCASELGYRLIVQNFSEKVDNEPATLLISEEDENKELIQPSDPLESTKDGETDNSLKVLLDKQISDLESEWSILVEDLQTQEQTLAAINVPTEDAMISGSLIKLFIMAAVYNQAAQNKLEIDPLYQDVYAMITVNDNEAANRLTRALGNGNPLLGRQIVNDYAASIGCKKVSYNCLMLENNGLQNYLSTSDCALILSKIYQGTCVNREYSQAMLDILKKQTINNGIPASLPKGIIVAHKTGDLSGICCADVGIVLTDTSAYILCIICNNQNTDRDAINKIAEISEVVYQYLINKKYKLGCENYWNQKNKLFLCCC